MRRAKNGTPGRAPSASKYDVNQSVLRNAYGALADLRRELSDSKAAVAERTELLKLFADCDDSQRAWLLLEDYFEKLDLARRDFPKNDWWPRLLAAKGRARLEETALLFLRTSRPLPTELSGYANLARLAEVEEQEREQKHIEDLERWLLPPTPAHLDAPRAHLRVLARLVPSTQRKGTHDLGIEFALFRPRSGEKQRTAGELIELTSRAIHEQELFPSRDWAFIEWLAANYLKGGRDGEPVVLNGLDLLQWLAQWGNPPWIEWAGKPDNLVFTGQLSEFTSQLEKVDGKLRLLQQLRLPSGESVPMNRAAFFDGQPALVAVDHTVYLLRNPPPPELLTALLEQPGVEVGKLGHRLITHLRRTGAQNGPEWENLCVAYTAKPQFVFELDNDTVRMRLFAVTDHDRARWLWSGHEWQRTEPASVRGQKPEILDDSRLDAAVQWLRRQDWFTPEPGLWIGDASDNLLATLAQAWPDRPTEAEYLGNPGFQRLFLAPRQLRPRILVKGSGINWFSVSAEWEQEGMRLSQADLDALAKANARFVKLPDSGWVELDLQAVRTAHETMADVGLDGLSAIPQKVDMLQAAHMDAESLKRFGDQPEAKALRRQLSEFKGVPEVQLPESVKADLRPYQKEGFDFLCHLHRIKLGGVLADDMGLGKTLQTLAWLAWLKSTQPTKTKPALVICPASVLHNWRREAERFTPGMRVLVLESGPARHNLRRQIPQHDLIVTNYALLRRDLEALKKFEFRAAILDEAQFIKNPAAQVSISVKQLRAEHRLALTGTPLENRLLDLWSIIDFVQPGYLGNQTQFHEVYEPTGENCEWAQRMARRKLSAKLRPLLLRRLKRQVAKDLPDRIEERRDCELGESQRKLYLAELRRSREQVMQTVQTKGLARSRIHVLAALTRLRQICCHPALVGNDSASGKTETLFELVEPLMDEGQKALVFSQFVQMLQLLEKECRQRNIPTHMLTGETKNRSETVQAFQDDPNPSLFLLSLRAAGTGLNLTTASYVILYDPWWNPAVEAQAIDRSHRIGQTQTVNAYRLIAPGTVEEKIWELQQRKAQTISDVLGEEGFARSLTQSDLEYLFSE